ncbi:MAG: tight adherence protein [Propionibacteriaceae bacterium]|jgi:tight adherence protein B|nr:type secretion system protein [Propionibacteriaceae bacterium]MDX6321265.1 tight adherence protein [Propionibacteriaceae bacterium]
MTSLSDLPLLVQCAIGGVAAGLLILCYLILGPRPVRLAIERRRPGVAAKPGHLASATTSATAALDKIIRRRKGDAGAAALEMAGLSVRAQDFTLFLVAGVLAAAAVGVVVGGPVLGLLLAVLVPVGAKVALAVLAKRRQSAFADQMDDSLQLMASSLRAGHSLLQALASVAREAESPTSVEFARVINETRVGRELGEALQETATRMGSQDFVWVTQAIAINREVGGNLAEVLDGVGHTIRERNQLRRQVQALAAEGKLSAVVLMALPFGIAAFLSFSNPAYIGKLVGSVAGYAMLGTAIVLLTVGAVWMRKVVSFKF